MEIVEFLKLASQGKDFASTGINLILLILIVWLVDKRFKDFKDNCIATLMRKVDSNTEKLEHLERRVYKMPLKMILLARKIFNKDSEQGNKNKE